MIVHAFVARFIVVYVVRTNIHPQYLDRNAIGPSTIMSCGYPSDITVRTQDLNLSENDIYGGG